MAGGSSRAQMPSSGKSMVTCFPAIVKPAATSEPIYPPPITVKVFFVGKPPQMLVVGQGAVVNHLAGVLFQMIRAAAGGQQQFFVAVSVALIILTGVVRRVEG